MVEKGLKLIMSYDGLDKLNMVKFGELIYFSYIINNISRIMTIISSL